MGKRLIGGFEVEAVGLGCMSLSHAYGTPPPPEHSVALLNRALDLGYDFLDTAALYGFGANEQLIGEAIGHRRSEFRLASKCGMTGVDGKRVIDGRPETLRRTLDQSLSRLRTDFIDLYYLHRWDKAVPIEKSVGALGDCVKEGKIGAVGLSEVSATTLRKANSAFPVAAVQNGTIRPGRVMSNWVCSKRQRNSVRRSWHSRRRRGASSPAPFGTRMRSRPAICGAPCPKFRVESLAGTSLFSIVSRNCGRGQLHVRAIVHRLGALPRPTTWSRSREQRACFTSRRISRRAR